MSNVNFKDYLNDQLKNPEFKKEFNNETAKLESALAVSKIRKDAGLSQRELAAVSKVPQSTIARIESGANTSVDTLTKIGNALGKKLTVSLS
ncbi:MAG: helix-turn-helix domain-containing protein [Lactobacillus sp.]|uniref:helix-turn-helix domain-containing protein n=1 Tax=Limosilactobacillus coleohominis TaxID=181675 RepID=UPI002A91DE31|nr:helix-turn-helix transcriptional regulator [Limosilactobacillus coleohominis]MCI5812027.1 helix-turn-helix domain-containing protein [Lactobacillus sp.]MDY5628729.1 helix-turn-helix transcriptional regulator [Limosilactobacillus coleohominis]